MEETALNIFKELGVSIDTLDIEACHRVGPPSQNKIIVKISGKKDKECGRSKNFGGMKLESLEVDNSVFINNSLCSFYKRLWSKCKRLWTYKYIYTFWVSNGSVKIKGKTPNPI